MSIANAAAVQPGQIWRDNCYYLHPETGECQPKYVLVLAIAEHGDLITAVLTSKSHGLPEHPACCLGPPRAGYYIGTPGGVLGRPTWIDFNSIQDVDSADFLRWDRQARLSLLPQRLPHPQFCGALRCVLGFDDLTGRQGRRIGDLAARLGCA